MKWLNNNRILAGFGLTLVILVINAVITYRNMIEAINHGNRVSHTNEVLAALEATLSTVVNAETGQRGYIITGEEDFLAPYNTAVSSIGDRLQQVKQLTADNPNQQQQIATLEPKINTKLSYLQRSIAVRREKGFAAAQQIVSSGQGKQGTDEIRSIILQMENEERQLLQRRSQEARDSTQETVFTFSIASGISLALLGLVYYLVKRDTTERQRTEKVLRESESRFRRLAESNIIGVMFANFNGKIWEANDAFLEIVGYSRQDLRLERLRWDAITPPEYRAVDERLIEATLRSGASPLLEKEYIRKDGKRIPILAGVALLEGSQDNCICFILDLTERKRAELALQRSAQRLAALHAIDRAILAAQSPEEIAQAALSRLRQLIPCQQAYLVLFNLEQDEAKMLAASTNGNLEPIEGITIPITDFVAANWQQQESIRYIEDIATLEHRTPVLEHRLADGMHSFIAVSLAVDGKEILGQLNLFANQAAAFNPEYVDIAREVADQLAIAIQQAELREQLQGYAAELEHRVAERTTQLQEANAELEAFAYSVSHDLRAPLRAMQGFAQALLEDYANQLEPLGQEYAQRIIAAADRMDTLINELLTYSRLSRAELRLQPVGLAIVVSQALADLKPEIEEKQAQIIVKQPLPDVMGHFPTLVQILINLIANALKFVASEVQPQVRIWVEGQETSQSKIRLWVEDNGIGIAPEYHQRIFSVFERLHGVETYPGTGIGLAIARKGIERMGGQVGVESQVSQGSRFWLDLPRVVSSE